MEKDGKNKSQHLGFLSHKILVLATLKMYKKFEDSGSHRSLEIFNRNFDWKERKMYKERKWNQEVDSFLHNATSHTQNLNQISNS